jgi:hypothetical protein
MNNEGTLDYFAMQNIANAEMESVLASASWIEDPGDGNCMNCDCDDN